MDSRYMTDTGGLQLLPNQRKNFQLAGISGGNTLLYAALGFVVLLAIAYVYFSHQSNILVDDIAAVDKELTAIQQARDKATETKLLNLKKQLTLSGTLLAKHIRWSEALTALNQSIQPRVVVRSLGADAATHTYQITASADTYATVARQVAAFYNSTDVTDVTLSSVTARTDGQVEFTMSVTFSPASLLASKP